MQSDPVSEIRLFISIERREKSTANVLKGKEKKKRKHYHSYCHKGKKDGVTGCGPSACTRPRLREHVQTSNRTGTSSKRYLQY